MILVGTDAAHCMGLMCRVLMCFYACMPQSAHMCNVLQTGNLGADGYGSVVGGDLGRSTQGGWYGFYKSVNDGRTSYWSDPSVC